MDLKDMYQKRAEEISLTEYGKGFDELDDETRDEVYNRAMELVAEDLQESADVLRKDMEMNI